MEIIKGIFLLLIVLGIFSLFSMKAPKGSKAMSGLANAAVASFLVEAVHSYITGHFLGIDFLKEVGTSSGSLAGVASAILVPIAMGANPVFAVVAGVSLSGFGILPGFVAGYVVGFIAPFIEKKLPDGLDLIIGAILIAPIARLIALGVDPLVNTTLVSIGGTISAAALQSPLVMGFLLGGIIKMICTSPLSSMALTAMLNLQGLAMGIAAIACFGGSFTNGMIFKRLKLGNNSNVLAVMLEPLTQAPIVTRNPFPIYSANFIGGGLAGMGAAYMGIINNSPGTASPIPGLLVPFAYNPAHKVIIALVIAAIVGTLAGYVVSSIYKKLGYKAIIPSELATASNGIISENTIINNEENTLEEDSIDMEEATEETIDTYKTDNEDVNQS